MTHPPKAYEFKREPKPPEPVFHQTAAPITRKYERPPGEITPESWQKKAACLGADIGPFFRDSEFTKALEYCQICAVIAECRELADKFEIGYAKPVGVWACETPLERVARRRRAGRAHMNDSSG